MRVRLINKFIAEIAQLDTAATAAYNPAGPATSGYDEDFREPVLEDLDGDGIGTSSRQESGPIRVPCQVEIGNFEVQQQAFDGDIPNSTVVLVFHFRTLEKLGLVDAASGDATIRKNDRLIAIYNCKTGALIQAFKDPPGMFVKEARPSEFGIGGKRNLLLVQFEDREQGSTRVG